MTKYFKNSYKELFSFSPEKIPFYTSIFIILLSIVFIVNGLNKNIYSSVLIVSSIIFLPRNQNRTFKRLYKNKKLLFIATLLILIPLPYLLPSEINLLSAKLTNEFLTSLTLFFIGYTGIRVSLSQKYPEKTRVNQGSAYTLLTCSITLVLLILGLIIAYIFINGAGSIDFDFLTQDISRRGAEGGVFPAIIGTILLGIGTLLTAIPLGVGTAIYLNEYSSRQNKSVLLVRTSVNVLYATPSIVFGLFGLALFVPIFGISLTTGSLILGFLVLPLIISASEEALEAVPQELRNSSLAMGATKWQTIKNVVLPSAAPGIITSIVLSFARALGETAPIMFTAVYFRGAGIPDHPLDPVQALSYHLLELTKVIGYRPVETNAWGTALILLAMVLITNYIGIKIRNKYSYNK